MTPLEYATFIGLPLYVAALLLVIRRSNRKAPR
jgi:hypothetical protein